MLTRNKINGPLSIAVLCATLATVSALPAAAAEVEEQRTTSSIADGGSDGSFCSLRSWS